MSGSRSSELPRDDCNDYVRRSAYRGCDSHECALSTLDVDMLLFPLLSSARHQGSTALWHHDCYSIGVWTIVDVEM